MPQAFNLIRFGLGNVCKMPSSSKQALRYKKHECVDVWTLFVDKDEQYAVRYAVR